MVHKILVFPLPFIGHSNPMVKIVNELVKTHNAKVIVYSIDNFKNQIESTNAEYRRIDDINYEEAQRPFLNNENLVQLLKKMIDNGLEILDKYTLKTARIIEEEKPDLVLYDSLSSATKFALEILNNNYKNREHLKRENKKDVIIPTSPAPLAITYWTTFISQKDVYPNEIEQKIPFENVTTYEKLQMIYLMLMGNFKFKRFCKKVNVKSLTFENALLAHKNIINLVLVFPELHTRSHLFDENVLFVGPCISDDVHITGPQQSQNADFSELLNKFPIINPRPRRTSHIINVLPKTENLRTDETDSKAPTKKLIYVSLGTVFNENVRLYSILIDAFKYFDVIGSKSENTNKAIKLNDLTVLFSLGKEPFEYFQKQIEKKSLVLPENIILKKSVPQLEVLKRASLFITHSGMNSTSESVHYGVPMICIPLMGDQPPNAYRIADELGLGIRFNFRTVKSIDIKLAVHKILSDESFYDRCSLYSILSSKYYGHKTSAEIIINQIEKHKTSQLLF